MGILSHTWIGCLLAFLPGPPRVKVYNANFQLFPVDKANKYCPQIQPHRDIRFFLFSSNFSNKTQIIRTGDDSSLVSSNLNLKMPMVIYFPPFFDGVDSSNVQEIKQAYLNKGGYNFIVVDSERLNAGPWYPAAVTNTFIVGKYTAFLIDYLILKGLSIKNLHLVGFSIGAHAAGVAGRFMKFGKPSRITGLDPASLLFVKKHPDMRLDKSDADLVDVIHTDPVFGMFNPTGHVDFFVDSDVYPQPGCGLRDVFKKSSGPLFAVFCSHLRSNKLYAESIEHPSVFPGGKCFSWKYFILGLCEPGLVQFMGFSTPPNARGIYYSNEDGAHVFEEELLGSNESNAEKIFLLDWRISTVKNSDEVFSSQISVSRVVIYRSL